jgi:hypothetical protein
MPVYLAASCPNAVPVKGCQILRHHLRHFFNQCYLLLRSDGPRAQLLYYLGADAGVQGV